MRRMKRGPGLLFSGRKFLVATVTICGMWLLMDALLFYSGPSTSRSADRVKDQQQARKHRLLDEYTAETGRVASSHEGGGFNRQGGVLKVERRKDDERAREEDLRENRDSLLKREKELIERQQVNKRLQLEKNSRLSETAAKNRDGPPSNEKLQRAFEAPEANDFPQLQNVPPVTQFENSERESLSGLADPKNSEKLADQALLPQRDWDNLALAKQRPERVLEAVLNDGGKSAGKEFPGVLEPHGDQLEIRQGLEKGEPEVVDAGMIKESQLKVTHEAIKNPAEANVPEQQLNHPFRKQSTNSKDVINRQHENEAQKREKPQDLVTEDGERKWVATPHPLEDPGRARKVETSMKKTWRKATLEPPRDGYVRIRDYNVRMLPFGENGPGEDGAPVATSIFEQKRVEAMWNLSYFNQLVSDKISVERSIPDTRHPLCSDKRYNYSLLSRVTVIICFTDEWWSALVRSVHSVLDRTPPEILEEVLLLDDFSQRPDLKDPLESYFAGYSKVRLIHLPERHGLIRARMVGVQAAKAKVVVFLDSHVEVNRGWLEPLLEAVQRNPKAVVSPVIDGIDAMDFRYKRAPDTIRGGFSWNLQFQWRVIPNYELQRRKGDLTATVRTPTIAGGLFAVNTEYFHELGEYDPGLDVWGAENLELSFKTWMCGGSLEIAPCSRVGHVFRSAHPYSFPGKAETLYRNTMRVAKVWLDDYINVVLKYTPQFRDIDTGDVSSRLELRNKLGCNSFQWYLDTVYPELYIPTFTPVAKGELRNLQAGTCLDHGQGGMPQVYPCHGQMGSQYFQLTEDNRLEVYTECIGLFNETVRVMDCNTPDLVLRFNHSEPGSTLVDQKSGLCLGIDPRGKRGHQLVQLAPCQRSRKGQKWVFLQYRDTGTIYKNASLANT